MNLDQCLGANRPLTFVVAESDVEILRHVDEKFTENNFWVYSTTLAGLRSLKDLLNPAAPVPRNQEAQTTMQVLDAILQGRGGAASGAKHAVQDGFTTYIILDCDMIMSDPQVIRKIKDILLRYQIDEEFTVNLLCISHKVCVPAQLERLSEMVFFDLPDEKALKGFSDTLAKKLELTGERAPSEEVVMNLKGMTLFETEQAYLQSHSLHKKISLDFIRDFKKSAIAKTDLLSLLDAQSTFDDIGGLDRLKAWAKQSAGGWTPDGKKFGLPLLKGLLMVGLPGCGKSLCCKALGSLWNLPVVDFDPSRVFSSRVGDSETNMRRVLKIAENLSPCIMWIDEIEKGLAGLQSSSYSDSGVTARVIRSFLVWMQENTSPVFVVATANSIASLPPEMISRFDEVFFVGLPLPKEREDILRIHIKKLGRDPDKFDLPLLAEASKDMSGREIEKSLRESMYVCFHGGTDLKTEVIAEVMSRKPTLLATMAENLKAIFNWVGWDDEKEDGLRARFASTPNPDDNKRLQLEIDKLCAEVEKAPPAEGGAPA